MVAGSGFCSACGTVIELEPHAAQVPDSAAVASDEDVASEELLSEDAVSVDADDVSSGRRLSRVWLIGGAGAALVLLLVGVVFVSGRSGSGTVTISDDTVSAVAVSVGADGVLLVSGFPSGFPVPSGAELISSFSTGSDETEVVTAVWSVGGDVSEVAGWYERSLVDGWVVEPGVALFGSTSFRISDDAGKYPESRAVLSQIGALTQVAVTLTANNLFSGVEPISGPDFREIPFGDGGSVVPPELPRELVIDGGRVVDASALPEGAIVTVRLSVDADFDEALAWYGDAVEGLGGDTTTTREGGVTVLTFDSVERSGIVAVVDGDPVEVFVMVRR